MAKYKEGDLVIYTPNGEYVNTIMYIGLVVNEIRSDNERLYVVLWWHKGKCVSKYKYGGDSAKHEPAENLTVFGHVKGYTWNSEEEFSMAVLS